MHQEQNPYENTVIYKIVCNDLNVKGGYIGHSINFEHRKMEHKSNCGCVSGKKYNLKLYEIIRKNGGWENYSMTVVQRYPCNNSIEAREKEQEYYEKLDSSLNTFIPYFAYDGTLEEKEKERLRIKYEKNKERLSEIAHEKFTCECGLTRSMSSKRRHLKSPIHIDLMNKKENEKL